jgi:hypothetical protein
METRNISLTLDKIKEWYNSDNKELKEIALQAYTEKELTEEYWKRIKTFKDACDALGINASLPLLSLETEFDFGKHLAAIYKLDIIRRALNRNWNPSLVDGNIFFPIIRFFDDYDDALYYTTEENLWIYGNIEIGDKVYTVVSGDICCHSQGLSNFDNGYGDTFCSAHTVCQTEEIALHMGKYFVKEIFDAAFAQFDNYNFIK